MSASDPLNTPVGACRLRLGGRVQGVGFRPFVYRLACRFGIRGWVRNVMGGVEVHAEAEAVALAAFCRALLDEAPAVARPELIGKSPCDCLGVADFRVLESCADGQRSVHLPPDLDTCPDCLAELRDPSNRRHGYPFINCTQCGPRYTLIAALPYDRANTAMAGFELCPDCRAEYLDPTDRRFHAEPLACPECGPRLRFQARGREVGDGAALTTALEMLGQGGILAVKGVGGYHLMCDARNADTVARLRARKVRPHKPLAVLCPQAGADGLQEVLRIGRPGVEEAAALRDRARPIVLIPLHPEADLAPTVAPGLDRVGVFLPYSPLHHLLLDAWGGPLVATSGNIGGEPVLTSEAAAEERLAAVADGFLHHDRPILRPADDSLVQSVGGTVRALRLGRGLAPLELELPWPVVRPTLAVGGHLKNSVALGWEGRLVVSPHIGDLESLRTLDILERLVEDLQALYGVGVERVVCDAHPAYASTRLAHRSGLEVVEVAHHHAHAAQLALEYPGIDRWLVFTWDGLGLGEDGALRGGEALLGRPGAWQRVASFRPFCPPGGDRAGRDPWRSAAALCWAAGRDFRVPRGQALVQAAWAQGINAPPTTAVGRLFDAAAALLGLVETASFEGQGPMWLEAAAKDADLPDAGSLPLSPNPRGILEADWEPILDGLQDEAQPVAERAAWFHAVLARTLVAQAQWLRERHGSFVIGLSGGVFQNRRLAETILTLLGESGFRACLPARLPCNDGGLCAGQLVEAAAADAGKR